MHPRVNIQNVTHKIDPFIQCLALDPLIIIAIAALAARPYEQKLFFVPQPHFFTGLQYVLSQRGQSFEVKGGILYQITLVCHAKQVVLVNVLQGCFPG